MQRYSLILLSACLCLSLVGRTNAYDRGRAILERAIKAAGDAGNLDKFKTAHAKYEGASFINGVRSPCTLEAWFQLPDQLKTVLRYEYKGKKDTLIQVVNGDKAWRHEAGRTQEATGHVLTELKESFHVLRVESLVPVLKDNSYRLYLLGQVDINDHPAVGVKVTSTGRVDVNLYFDKESGLLVKSEHWLPDLTGKKVFRESHFSEFQEIDGFRQPTRLIIYQDREKVLDVKLMKLEFPDKIEASEFMKP